MYILIAVAADHFSLFPNMLHVIDHNDRLEVALQRKRRPAAVCTAAISTLEIWTKDVSRCVRTSIVGSLHLIKDSSTEKNLR